MKNSYTLFLSGIVIWLAYYVTPLFSLLIFVPLFYFIANCRKINDGLPIFCFFCLFNIIPTYWLVDIQIIQGITAWLLNSSLMFLVAVISIYVVKIPGYYRIVVFISFWLVFELVHHIWVFNWPWLSLGNIFCTDVKYIQWYRFTGVEGGTFWILVMNYLLLRGICEKKQRSILFTLFGVILIIPIFISFHDFYRKEKTESSVYPVIITQPNANALKGRIDEYKLIDDIFLEIYSMKIPGPSILLLPETFIKERVWDGRFKDCRAVQKIINKLSEYPKLSVITGIILNYSHAVTSSQDPAEYKSYDAAIYLDKQGGVQIHCKGNLIPVEEHLPGFLNGLGLVSDNFSPGSDYNTFRSENGNVFSVSICYEILFGHSMANINSKGSGAILMMANEQMLTGLKEKQFYTDISRLRAIEGGKYIVKSSNTGFSGVINEKGQTVFMLRDDQFGVACINIPILTHSTFYTNYFNVINLFIFCQAGVFFGVHLFSWLFKKRKLLSTT